MAGGDSFTFILRDLTDNYGSALDSLYALGVLYGLKKCMDWIIFGCDAARVYLLQFGSVAKDDFPNRFGEWAGNGSMQDLIPRCTYIGCISYSIKPISSFKLIQEFIFCYLSCYHRLTYIVYYCP